MKEFKALNSFNGKMFFFLGCFGILIAAFLLFYPTGNISWFPPKPIIPYLIAFVVLLIFYFFSIGIQKIQISKDFIKKRGWFFVQKKAKTKDIIGGFEKISHSAEGSPNYTTLILKTTNKKRIALDQPFFEKDWNAIEKEIESVCRIKIKKL